MKRALRRKKAQCVSWFIETKSDIQAQRNFSLMSENQCAILEVSEKNQAKPK